MGQLLMTNGGPVHQESYEYKAQMKELGVTLGESSACDDKHSPGRVCMAQPWS